jgi:FKBP-type peptidyl-prolyl cis-trans isomerase 2
MVDVFDVRRFSGVFKRCLRRSTLYAIMTLCLILSLAGCTGSSIVKQESVSVVNSGDSADISYICKLKDGEVAASTDALADNQPKSALYLPVGKGPVTVNAGEPFPELAGGKEMALEHEIEYRLADLVVGMKEGESRPVELTAEDISTRTEQNYVLHLARVRKRPREIRMPVDEFMQRAGKPAEVGQPFIYDPAIPGKVESITDQYVIIRFSPKPGGVVKTAFGQGSIRETEKEFEIVIDATVGALVRTGNLIGRITDVDDKTITVDYRNPFGREKLTCDVTVAKITAAKQTADPKAVSPQRPAATDTTDLNKPQKHI